VRRIGDDHVSVAPYPFRKDRLPISILARRLPKGLYGDASDFRRMLARARYFGVNLTPRKGDAVGQTRNAIA
jgi:hypothetical protein